MACSRHILPFSGHPRLVPDASVFIITAHLEGEAEKVSRRFEFAAEETAHTVGVPEPELYVKEIEAVMIISDLS